MTTYSNAKKTFDLGEISIDIKSVNNRYLDLNFKVPDEIKTIEFKLRELISHYIQRGKVEIKIRTLPKKNIFFPPLNKGLLQYVASQVELAREYIPDTPAPRLQELVHFASLADKFEDNSENQTWLNEVLQLCEEALIDFVAMRSREGQRLSKAMQNYTTQIIAIIEGIESRQTELKKEYQDKLVNKLKDLFAQIYPDGFSHITGEELSQRLANESSFFTLRIDIEEEITRLKSHAKELMTLITATEISNPTRLKNNKSKQSLGKRLDFLFQEMNREINTLGSKSASLNNTQDVIDLKLLVDQLREQALNIE